MNCRPMYKPDKRELHDPSKTPGETKNAGVGPAQRTLPEPAALGHIAEGLILRGMHRRGWETASWRRSQRRART